MIKDAYGVLHKALAQAAAIGMIHRNLTENCSLPKLKAPEPVHYEADDIKNFLAAIHDHCHENYYKVLLFTGMREAEGLGLTWDCISFAKGTIEINKQLRRNREILICFSKGQRIPPIEPKPSSAHPPAKKKTAAPDGVTVSFWWTIQDCSA